VYVSSRRSQRRVRVEPKRAADTRHVVGGGGRASGRGSEHRLACRPPRRQAAAAPPGGGTTVRQGWRGGGGPRRTAARRLAATPSHRCSPPPGRHSLTLFSRPRFSRAPMVRPLPDPRGCGGFTAGSGTRGEAPCLCLAGVPASSGGLTRPPRLDGPAPGVSSTLCVPWVPLDLFQGRIVAHPTVSRW